MLEILILFSFGAFVLGNQTISKDCLSPDLKLGCPAEIKISWWNISPYVFNTSDNKVEGQMRKIVELMFRECCGKCIRFSYDDPTEVSLDLWKKIGYDGNAVYFPVYGIPHELTFQGNPYYSVIEPPGSIFFQGPVDKRHMPKAVMKAVFSGWPVFVLSIVMAALSGIVIWAVDSFCNEDFPKSFFAGSWNGFWWAFVSMTTVGYGDRVPKSFMAKVFAFFWVLIGLVIIGILVANISTELTATCLRSDTDIVGKSITALEHSPEEKFGNINNAQVTTVTNIDEFVALILSGEVAGGLLDSYMAGFHKEKLKPLRFSRIFEDNYYSYGFVLASELDGILMRKCLRRKLTTLESQIDQIVLQMDVMSEPPSDEALAKSLKLFDGSSSYFQMAVIVCVAISAVLLLGCVFWEYMYYRPRKGVKPVIEKEKVKLHPSKMSHLEVYGTQCRDAEKFMIGFVETFYKSFNDKIDDAKKFKVKEF